MCRCARDAAVAHRFDIRVRSSGVTGSGGTGIPGAPFFISGRVEKVFHSKGVKEHGTLEQRQEGAGS